MKFATTLFFLLLVTLISRGDNPLVKQWDYSYGGYDGDFVYQIIPTPDGGFLAAGTSLSNALYEKSADNWDQSMFPTADCWLIKCDENGVQQWDRTLGGTSSESLFNIILTSDSGFLMLTSTNSPASGDISEDPIGIYDMWIVKLNSDGDIQWEHRYGGDGNNGPGDAVQLQDGGFLIGGYTNALAGDDVSEDGYGDYDFWVLRLDASGNKIWDKKYGGDNTESVANVIRTEDGGFLLQGSSYSGISGLKTVDNYQNNHSDLWFVKIDSAGNYMWDRVIGSLDDEYGTDMFETIDHHYVICTSTNANAGADKSEDSHGVSDFWMMKTDTLLNIIWNHSIGGDNNEDDFGNIFETAAGDYMLAGTSYSGINDYKSEENNGPENTWILLLDTAGNRIWDKTIHTGYTHTELGLGIQLTGGCYLFANDGDAMTAEEKTDMSYNFDYWCIKYCDTTAIQQPTSSTAFAVSDTDICEKFCIYYVDSSTNNPTAWQWIMPGGEPDFSTEQNPGPVCYDVPGVYDVTLITTSPGGNDTLTLSQFITVYQTPMNPVITINGNTITCSNAFAYQWQLNTVDIPGATNQTYEASQSGFYTVLIFNEQGCASSSSIDVILEGMNELPSADQFFVYPNPSSGILNLKFDDSSTGNLSISVWNELGQEVYRLDGTLLIDNLQIDLSKQSAGFYNIQINTPGRTLLKKVLITSSGR